MFHTHVKGAVLTMFSILALGPGCGGGTMGTSGEGFHSGLNEKLRIHELPQKDAMQLCERSRAYFEEVFSSDYLCRLLTVLSALEQQTTPQACEDELQQCLAMVAGQDPVEVSCELDDQSGPTPEFATCPAPIGLFEDCIDEIFGSVQDFIDRANCALDDESLLRDANSFFSSSTPQTPKCLELEHACPGILNNKK